MGTAGTSSSLAQLPSDRAGAHISPAVAQAVASNPYVREDAPTPPGMGQNHVTTAHTPTGCWSEPSRVWGRGSALSTEPCPCPSTDRDIQKPGQLLTASTARPHPQQAVGGTQRKRAPRKRPALLGARSSRKPWRQQLPVCLGRGRGPPSGKPATWGTPRTQHRRPQLARLQTAGARRPGHSGSNSPVCEGNPGTGPEGRHRNSTNTLLQPGWGGRTPRSAPSQPQAALRLPSGPGLPSGLAKFKPSPGASPPHRCPALLAPCGHRGPPVGVPPQTRCRCAEAAATAAPKQAARGAAWPPFSTDKPLQKQGDLTPSE